MKNLRQRNQIKLTMINGSSGKMNDYIDKERTNYANKTSIVNNMLCLSFAVY
jgi:hypothetical protein